MIGYVSQWNTGNVPTDDKDGKSLKEQREPWKEKTTVTSEAPKQVCTARTWLGLFWKHPVQTHEK